MHKDLLVAARYFGDIKLSINGETRVAFSVNDIWSNTIIQTISSDQGALYPFDQDKPDARCALSDIGIVLSGLTLVPFQNDIRYQEHVTPEAQDWLNKQAWQDIVCAFLGDKEVYKVTVRYRGLASFGNTIVISAELQINDYCIGFKEAMKQMVTVNEISSIYLDDALSYVVTLLSDNGDPREIVVPMDGGVMFVGVSSASDAKYCYSNQNEDLYILTNIPYDLRSSCHGKQVVI